MASIWKDYFVDLGNGDTFDYRITSDADGNAVIYSGRAYMRPDQTTNTIKINEICADYLRNTLPSLESTSFTQGRMARKFYVWRYDSGKWTLVDSVLFTSDWSYDYKYDPLMMGMSAPILRNVAKNMWLLYTAYESSSVTIHLDFQDGSSANISIPIERGADFNNDYNEDYDNEPLLQGTGTISFDLAEYPNVKTITINGQTYDVVEDCYDYALYYVNAYGGWDFLIVEGLTTTKDSLTRHTRSLEYDNRLMRNRGKQNYVNEIIKSYTMHTGWLSDEQSAWMHHLLNSTEVYLGDLSTGEMIPLVLTDNVTEHKTYKSNGAQLVNYTINADVAQYRIRR